MLCFVFFSPSSSFLSQSSSSSFLPNRALKTRLMELTNGNKKVNGWLALKPIKDPYNPIIHLKGVKNKSKNGTRKVFHDEDAFLLFKLRFKITFFFIFFLLHWNIFFFFLAVTEGIKKMDSKWSSNVMLQCSLKIRKKVQLTRGSLTWRNCASVAHSVLQQLIPDLPAEHTRVLSLVLLDPLLHVGSGHLLQFWKKKQKTHELINEKKDIQVLMNWIFKCQKKLIVQFHN